MRWVALMACGVVCAAQGVHAAAPSVSYSTWIIGEHGVTLRYVLSVAEARGLTGSEVPVLTVSKLGDYVLRHVSVSSDQEDCPAIDQGYDLGKVDPLEVGAGLYGFEIVFRCSEPGGVLRLHEHALFDRVAGHVDFARIERDGRTVRQLFTAAQQDLRVAPGGALPAAGSAQYAHLGVLHLLSDADQWCLLLAALVLVRRGRELASLMAALAGGYALSLLAQATGLILPRAEPIEAFVGFLVVMLAASIAVRETSPPHRAALAWGWPALLVLLAIGTALAHAPRAALLLFGAALISGGLLARFVATELPAVLCTGVFGFLDGFTLPALLTPLHLATRAATSMAGAYDAGALLAAWACLGLVAGGFALARSRSWARGSLPRPLINDLAAACFGCIGTFWFLSRLHS